MTAHDDDILDSLFHGCALVAKNDRRTSEPDQGDGQDRFSFGGREDKALHLP